LLSVFISICLSEFYTIRNIYFYFCGIFIFIFAHFALPLCDYLTNAYRMNKRKILSFQEAQQVLAPYYDKISQSVLDGFEDFQKTSNCIAERVGFFESEIRTKACLIHDLIKNRIIQNFFGEQQVETGKWRGVFALKINDDLFIRFKKLNKDYTSSNYLTKQAKGYLRQIRIEGFPDEPTFLFAGYIPDKSWTGISGIYIACWDGDKIQWVEEIISRTSSVQTVLPFTVGEQEAPQKRVKIKSQNQASVKTGTDD